MKTHRSNYLQQENQDPTGCPEGPSLGDIRHRIERRMSWYDLPWLTARPVETTDGENFVVEFADGAGVICREVIDGRTGVLVRRTPVAMAGRNRRTKAE